MCQLLGMNSSKPSEFCAIFSDFARRGGDIDVHRHGVGLAFYNNTDSKSKSGSKKGDKEFYMFRDTMPAAFSPKLAKFVMEQKYLCTKTINMISHIRYATKGCVSLDNVHPFTREMWGTKWVFAHNGDIPRFSNTNQYEKSSFESSLSAKYIPNGTTDSEAVFCEILNSLQREFTKCPPLNILYQTIQRLCHDIVDNHNNNGENHQNNDPIIFNFLLSCNENVLMSFSWPGSRPGSKVWNGLYYQIQQESSSHTAIIATKPLDIVNGNWIEMKKGELLLFYKGLPYTMNANNNTLDVKQQHATTAYSSNDNTNNVRIISDLILQEVYTKGKDDFVQEVSVF